MTTPVDELADRYVERLGELDPVIATFEGITGHDAEMTDYSPDGIEERLTFDRSVLRQLAETPLQSARATVWPRRSCATRSNAGSRSPTPVSRTAT